MTVDIIGKENGPYFSRMFSDLELDAKTLSVIPDRYRKGEASLYPTKHAKYRGLHPMAATMLFAEAYVQAYKWALRKREDIRTVKSYKVFSAANPIDDTEQNRLGLWNARRAADQIGADYEQFCFHALDYSERASWKRLAMPRELANSNVIEAVVEKLTPR
jgi:hypothetical protein